MVLALAAVLCAAAGISAAGTAAAGPAKPWLAPGQPIAARVAALLAQMTPQEKHSQLQYWCPQSMNWSSTNYAGTGVGSVGIECSGELGDAMQCDIACRIATLRQFQLDAINQTRLGIPVTFVIETSHSGAAGGVSSPTRCLYRVHSTGLFLTDSFMFVIMQAVFPMGVTQGSSWNTSAVGAVARAIALEARSWGGSRGLSPEISVVTDQRFGRTEENYAGDPLLATKMAEAAVVGLQGGEQPPTEYLPTPNASVGAEAKHCCAYGFSGLDGGAADLSEKTLHDIYLKPWRAFVRKGGSGVMMSHNEINGMPMHANADFMKHLFRETWNYTGFFHSDFGNVGWLQNSRIAGNLTHAAGLALAAGVDQTFMDGGECLQ